MDGKECARSALFDSARVLVFSSAFYLVVFLLLAFPDGTGFAEALPALGADFLYLLSGAVAIGLVVVLLRLLGRSRGSFVALAYYLMISSLLIAAEFSFFSKTGSYFSLSMLWYTFRHSGEMGPVLLSGVDLKSVLALLAVVLFSCLGLIFSVKQRGNRASLLAAIGLLAFFGMTVLQEEASDDASALMADSGSGSLFVSFLSSDSDGTPLEQLAADYGYSVEHFERPSEALPNVIVFISESTRADVIPGFSGSVPKASMPALQWLQSSGATFDRAYTTTSHTSKALVGILCGIHPSPYINIVEATPGGIPVRCLPQVLQEFGYNSLFIQSATSEFEDRQVSVQNMGFDRFISKEGIQAGFQSSGYFGVDEMAMLMPFQKWWSDAAAHPSGKSPRLTVFLTSMTHHPYQKLGESIKVDAAQMKDGYLKNLSRTDELLGGIIDFLRARGELSNTIIVVTGDHGEAFGEHGVYQHDAVPFEEGVRVPLVLWDGRHPIAARWDDALRQHLDIVPTLLNTIGVKVTGEFPGRDLNNAVGHQQVITSCWGVGDCKALVQKDMKWIFHSSSKRLQAYSLAQDPLERSNIAGEFSLAQKRDVVSTLQYGSAGVAKFYAAVRNAKSSGN